MATSMMNLVAIYTLNGSVLQIFRKHPELVVSSADVHI